MYKVINIETWNRKEYYKNYIQEIPCSYSLVTHLDISKLYQYSKEQKIKLYVLLVHSITKAVNKSEAFRYQLINNKLVLFDYLDPAYTVLNTDKSFSSLWTPYTDDIKQFSKDFIKTNERFIDSNTMTPQNDVPINTFDISMIPWIEFSSFSLHLPKGDKFLLPIFTIGKFKRENHKITIPLAIQVNHAVIDGYHVGLFIEKLQNIINEY